MRDSISYGVGLERDGLRTHRLPDAKEIGRFTARIVLR